MFQNILSFRAKVGVLSVKHVPEQQTAPDRGMVRNKADRWLKSLGRQCPAAQIAAGDNEGPPRVPNGQRHAASVASTLQGKTWHGSPGAGLQQHL